MSRTTQQPARMFNFGTFLLVVVSVLGMTSSSKGQNSDDDSIEFAHSGIEQVEYLESELQPFDYDGIEYDAYEPLFHQHNGGPCNLCNAMRPRWIFRGNPVYFDRLTEDSDVLIQNTVDLAQQINARDFNFDLSSGYELSVLRKNWEDNAWELRYLDLGDFNSQRSTTSPASQMRINATPPVFAPNVQAVEATFEGSFYSIEANYHWALYDCVTLLAGLRYVSFDDTLRATFDAAPQTFLLDVATENDLYGGQLGFTTVPHRPFQCDPILGCLSISSDAKVGVYGNDATNRSLVDTGASRLLVDDSADNVSVLGELGITAALEYGDRISVFCGYRLMWLERVAVASDQIEDTDFFLGTGSDDRGRSLFHGASFGLQFQL